MIRFLYFLSLIFFCFNSEAITKPKFLPLDRNVVVNIAETDITGAHDTDASDLYAIMNVEEQQTSMGTGKSIKTAQKDFNMVCSKDKKTCSFVLNKSPNTFISGSQKFAKYSVSGETADALIELFHLNDQRVLLFVASDQMFSLKAEQEFFHFEVRGL